MARFWRNKIDTRKNELGDRLMRGLRSLLEALRATRPDEPPEKHVMRVFECQKSIDRAAKLSGAKRITHPDLRHLFATRRIENGAVLEASEAQTTMPEISQGSLPAATDKSQAVLRDHSAFLNSYAPQDEGLYDDAATR
jgi:integrase